MKKPNKEKELRKYHWYKIKNASVIQNKAALILILLFIISHILHKPPFDIHEKIGLIVLSAIEFYLGYNIYGVIKKIRNNNYPLVKLQE